MDNKSEMIKKLVELKQLYEAGVLTKEELESEKRKVMEISASDDVTSENKTVTTPQVQELNDTGEEQSHKTAVIAETPPKASNTEQAVLRGIILTLVLIAVGLGIFAYYKVKERDNDEAERTTQSIRQTNSAKEYQEQYQEQHDNVTAATSDASRLQQSSVDDEYEEDYHGHYWGSGQVLHHTFSGVMTDDDGNNWPIELNFDLQTTDRTQLNGKVFNVIYKNVTLGGKIRMTGELEDGLLVFRGKDGAYDFIINIDVYSHQGNAMDGPVQLPLWVTPLCH